MNDENGAKTIFAVVDWRSMDNPISRFENPHNRLKHYFADRLGIYAGPVIDSYVGNPLKETITKALKFAVRIIGALHGRNLPKKEADDGR